MHILGQIFYMLYRTLFLSVQEKDWCKLTCKADSSPSHFYRLNIKVIDGTKCRPDHNDICVDGKCRVSICSPVFLAMWDFQINFIFLWGGEVEESSKYSLNPLPQRDAF